MVSGISIAVVDDDEAVRESLTELLRRLGYGARGFTSAKEFLASGSAPHMGCLILDVAMPGMSGLDLQHELIRRGHRIPTIFISALEDESLPRDLLDHGGTAFLAKPIGVQELRGALAALLRAP